MVLIKKKNSVEDSWLKQISDIIDLFEKQKKCMIWQRRKPKRKILFDRWQTDDRRSYGNKWNLRIRTQSTPFSNLEWLV